ncbi:type 2 lanthipeptide synthetase LanM family protein [Actinomadura rubrisoli]|uniref:Type 2 lantipeptide synthetase LanM n=1 Tax=Actinomadura rubrisoli TaxID=2530368 RepID=A0A4R5BY07_9ACTN|nr:type 2 lanthipeptide synthetase LanM family protein [Actinomadura rubrisoli]TDD89274.1 type 2 lantipeptide synthetase LanM [Actinomadura rubrisoli]
MDTAFPYDIAARAGNLSERLRAVAVLGEPPAGTGGPEPIDRWRIGRLAAKLARKFDQESAHRGREALHGEDEIAACLSAYGSHERSPSGIPADLLNELHGAWLPTYRDTLGSFTPGLLPAAGWRAHDIYYARYAKVCEPFLVELGRRLGAMKGLGKTIDPQVAEDFQRHFLDRFELMLAWALEAHANVYCSQVGIDPEKATPEEYLRYVDETFQDAGSYHRFYLEFPVLGRWLAHVTRLVADFALELAERLTTDSAALARTFFDRDIIAFRSVRAGESDYHAGGKSVVLVEVELSGGERENLVYKPRCIRSEAAVQRLLGRLRDDGVVGFRPRAVLPRDGYGYEAFIPSGRNHVDAPADVARIYGELGGYLAIFYVLGGSDLHFENVIIADGHAHVCDCETVLGVLPAGQGRARPEGTLLDSVFKTGLLEWPTSSAPDRDGGAAMRVSGYSGGEAYEMPTPVPKINDRRATFGASVTHATGVRVRPSASNRVFLNGGLVRPEDHADAIAAGFDRVYAWFQARPSAFISEIFAGTAARFINWGTQIYSQLLMSARHPRCLVEPLEVDLLANTVRTFPRSWDRDGILARCELDSMWRLDVPIFTADAHGDRLVHAHTESLDSPLEVSPVGFALRRIERLSERNRHQQGQYIAASLSTGEVGGESFRRTCAEYASRVGERLVRTLRDPGAPSPWTSYQLGGGRLVEVDVEADLYHGTAGIALFLAYLDALAPRPAFRRAAERAVDHAVEHSDGERIGAFSGTGGIIYLLTHLHRLWDEPACLIMAKALSRGLTERIEDDKRFDILGGAAGLIPVLAGLAQATGGEGLDQAHACAGHLLRHAEADGDTLSWPCDPGEAVGNLTGFSHGTAGIGWSLILLGRLTGRAEYIDAGRRAFAYEARHFDKDEQDWYDLRVNSGGTLRNGRHYANAWCNGAAGIGLSRIASWAILGKDDEPLLREAHQGLSATMRNFPRLMNDTLCHGRAGNAELLLRFGLLHDEAAFRIEANVQAQTLWRNLDDADEGTSDATAGFFPSLMIGMSGFGLHFLRLADPDRVPSPLLLDPPAAAPRDPKE